MPVEPSSTWLEKLGFRLPPRTPPPSPEEQARMDKAAKQEQTKDSIWKQYARKAFETAADIPIGVLRGIYGGDPTPSAPVQNWTNFGTQSLAALPMAVPKKLHKVLEYLAHRNELSPEYTGALTNWSSGMAMHRPEQNLLFAERLRGMKDVNLIQDRLREAIGDTIPAYRGVSNDEVSLLRNIYGKEDPGIRSFSLDPKVTHVFADRGVSWPRSEEGPLQSVRAQRGQIYRADVPTESVLGIGDIPYQRELIVDLKKVDPHKNIKILRNLLEGRYDNLDVSSGPARDIFDRWSESLGKGYPHDAAAVHKANADYNEFRSSLKNKDRIKYPESFLDFINLVRKSRGY